MRRYIGVDVGSRRIGVAVSDPFGSMALPLETIDGRDGGKAARRIATLVAEYEAAGIVVGWPIDMRGKEGAATRMVAAFLGLLDKALARDNLSVDVHRWDERLTTHAAEALMIEADISRAKRKETVDQIAAAHILQGYLDALRIQAARESDGEDNGQG
ncbi:MAG: Holliday junction resolvase RuvX [Bradymonadaceae bacterium]|nr:Holliday junction resolvase RuvX [Lujinxingiaceae bacterium]